MGFVMDGWAVDVAHARVGIVHEVESSVDVFSEDRRRQPVFGVVRFF